MEREFRNWWAGLFVANLLRKPCSVRLSKHAVVAADGVGVRGNAAVEWDQSVPVEQTGPLGALG